MKQHNIIIFVRTHDGSLTNEPVFPPDEKNVSDLFEHDQLLVWQPYYFFNALVYCHKVGDWDDGINPGD